MRNLITITEEVTIGEIILEVGDKIELVTESSSEFDYEFPISIENAEKISNDYGSPWDKEEDIWMLYNSRYMHVMTFIPREGKLFTDYSIVDINNMIRRG